MAVPTNIIELAGLVDFAETGLAILAVAGVLVVLYVTWRGAAFVIESIQMRREYDRETQEMIEEERERWGDPDWGR